MDVGADEVGVVDRQSGLHLGGDVDAGEQRCHGRPGRDQSEGADLIQGHARYSNIDEGVGRERPCQGGGWEDHLICIVSLPFLSRYIRVVQMVHK